MDNTRKHLKPEKTTNRPPITNDIATKEPFSPIVGKGKAGPRA